jgi:hypothetical protein
MAAILDFSKFTFGVEEIRAVKELLFDDVVASPEIDLLHTVYPNIVYDKEIGFIGKGGLVGIAHQGCDPTPQDYNIGTRVVKWEPKAWEILIAQCAKDIEATAAVYSLKAGVELDDFTSSDYINIIVEVLAVSVKEFIIRLAWFSDKSVANVKNGGILKDGVNTAYFNIIDGLFKQIDTQITANSTQKITITENAGASYAAQALKPENVLNTYLPQLVFNADLTLRANANAFIPCTQSFYDAYSRSLQGTTIESLYTNLVDGQKTLTYNGIPLFPIPIWDTMIKSYFDNGTKLYNPHRALYIVKDNIAVGVDSTSSFGDMDIWYNKDERRVKIEAKGKADAKLLNPVQFQIAI